MKKSILLFAVALGMLTACDPIKEDGTFEVNSYTSSNLLNGAEFSQYADQACTTPKADGNWIKYNIPNVSGIYIYYVKPDGSEFKLTSGAAGGVFNFVPARGSDPNQTVYFRYINANNEETIATHEFTVEVAAELKPEVRIIASNAYGKKTWKWDTQSYPDQWFAGAVWGNLGYTPGDGDTFVDSGNGIWWGAKPEELTGQLNHSDTGVATGEEDPNAYMVFTEDGLVNTYTADGTIIRGGTYEIKDWSPENPHQVNGVNWHIGTLVTDKPALLFPFKINGGGTTVTSFEILQLTPDEMKLVYADAGTGGWSEATWWAFRSNSDGDGCLTEYDKKDWTWDTESYPDQWFAGAVWGNFGYTPGDGDSFVNAGNGIWWGAKPEELTGQLQHSDTGTATGEESAAAYMTFTSDGLITTYAADGSEIRGGTYEITEWNPDKPTQVNGVNWNIGKMTTNQPAILFPFKINGGGTTVTSFEIMQLTNEKMKLVYADEGTGGWSEATWWAFKKK
jgi:hypothetical protein